MKLKTAIKALILRLINRILTNELYMAYHGDDFYWILWDLDQHYLRDKVKYNVQDESDEALKAYDNVRTELYRLMEQHGVDFWHVD